VLVALRRTARSRTAEFGSLYKGREGQWSWIAHRVTGVAIILFLFAHVVDTALVGWGPDAYNRVVSVYHNPFIRLLELGLVAAVIYHALNGVRIMIIDFWPKANEFNRRLIYTTTGIFVLSMIPISLIIVTPIVEKYFFTFPSWWPF
jgi:succinate dehydrogenase / fumarate reductase, cytochrome b subunit